MHDHVYPYILQQYCLALEGVSRDTSLLDTLDHAVHELATYSKWCILGIGKNYWLAQRLAATGVSLGLTVTAPRYEDLVHGAWHTLENSGLLCLSKSGSTQEIRSILVTCRHQAKVLITASNDMSLDLEATVIRYTARECDTYNIIPLTSLLLTSVLGDLLLTQLAYKYNSTYATFLTSHPGGVLGTQTLSPRQLQQCPFSPLEV